MTNIVPVRTRIFQKGEDLVSFIMEHAKLHDGDVLAITSKIVSLSENRSVPLIHPDDKRRWIERESEEARETAWCLLTKRNGEWCANAGVDESNANGELILLPKNPLSTVRSIQRTLLEKLQFTRLGIVITDTRLAPLRRGTRGIALAWAGFDPLRDYVGRADLFGREMRMTVAGVADALAVTAVIFMGEGGEGIPLVVISGAPVSWDCSVSGSSRDLVVPPEDDIYGVVYGDWLTERG